MKQYVFVGLLMVCVGCSGESLTSGPSPIETYDQDRLYVLINAAVSRGRAVECARYFQEADNQASDNPNAAFIRAALSQVCPESMVKMAAYLEHNGVAGVKPAHVKDMALLGADAGESQGGEFTGASREAGGGCGRYGVSEAGGQHQKGEGQPKEHHDAPKRFSKCSGI